MKSFISKIVVVAVVAMTLSFPGITNAQWVAPTLTPPSGNASVPLNLSSTYQSKVGALTINTGGAATGFTVPFGNVGIGDTNPGIKLSIIRPAGAGSTFDFRISEGTYWMGLNPRSSAGSWTPMAQAGDHVLLYTDGSIDTGALVIGPWSSTAKGLRINSSGNVGIGTVSPNKVLEIMAADSSNTTPGTGNAALRIVNNTSTGNTLTEIQFANNQVSNSKYAAISGVYINGSNNTQGDVIISTRNSSSDANLTERIRVTSGGNVGIGNTVPSQKLDVTGDVVIGTAASSRIYMRDDESTTAAKSLHANSNVIGLLTGASTWLTYWDNSGNQQNTGAVTATAFYYSSDKNLKKNIAPLKDSLSKILKLDGVSFDWKKDGKSSVGIIAQDVEKVYPELVSTDPKTGLKSVEYGNLVAPLIEAVKEQQKQIDSLRSELEALKAKK